MTKIAKGECRGKRKFYFRMDYAEPHLIFVFTNVQKGIVNASFYFRYNNIIVYLCHTITFYKLKIKNGLYPDKVSWDIVLALDV